MNSIKSSSSAGTTSDSRDVSNAQKAVQWGRWLTWCFAAIVIAKGGWLVAHTPAFEWNVVARWFAARSIVTGLMFTLGLTVISMTLGVIGGLCFAIARLSENQPLRWFSVLFIWFFRGTPLMVQLVFWYNLATLFPKVQIDVPFGPTLGPWSTNELITPLVAAIAGLALNEAAYMAEIIRAGLLAVDSRQRETAMAFGMTRWRTLRRIVIPQAMRFIVPPTGNQLISMIKATSLVSVIAMGDLLYSVQAVYNRTFEVIPLLIVAVLWYLAVTTVLNVGQSAIERYYARSEGKSANRKRKSTRVRFACERSESLTGEIR